MLTYLYLLLLELFLFCSALQYLQCCILGFLIYGVEKVPSKIWGWKSGIQRFRIQCYCIKVWNSRDASKWNYLSKVRKIIEYQNWSKTPGWPHAFCLLFHLYGNKESRNKYRFCISLKWDRWNMFQIPSICFTSIGQLLDNVAMSKPGSHF